jgi:hypothetical protein
MRGRSSSKSSRSSSSSSRSSSSRGRGGSRSRGPVSRVKNSLSQRSRRSRGSSSIFSGFWPISLGVVGVIGLGYGLMQIASVREFMRPVIDPVSNLFGLLEDDGIDTSNLTHDRTYSGSTVGGTMVHQ